MKKLRIIGIIILITIAVLFIAAVILSMPLVAGDEFINYQNTCKIFNGEEIYNGVNIISTPLLFYIAIAFFKLFGSSFFVFRIYNIIINIIVAVMIYKIFLNLKIQRLYSIIYTLILEIAIVFVVVGKGPTYNILGLLIALIGINFYITKKKTVFHNVIQGIVIFLIIMTKQNIGIYYGLAYVIIELIINRKKGIKQIIKTFCITSFGIMLYTIYLAVSGNLYGFINYTILGLKEFTRNVAFEGINFIIIDVIIVIIILMILYKKRYDIRNFENIITVFVFGTLMLVVGYPIADEWHMVVASIVLWILGIYILHINIISKKTIKEKILIKIIGCILYFMLICSITIILKYGKDIYINENNKFNLIVIQEKTKKEISIMEEFIKTSDKKVVIVSHEARNV